MIDRDGSPWFVAKDVCDALEYTNVSEALRKHVDDDDKGLMPCETHGGKQRLNAINESGLYSLILKSRKPEAKAFKKWVTSEVLPSIRKTGGYMAPAVVAPKTPLNFAGQSPTHSKPLNAAPAGASLGAMCLYVGVSRQ